MVAWLKQQTSASPELHASVAALEKGLEGAAQTAENFAASSGKGLDELYRAGLAASLGAGPVTLGERLQAAEQDDKFVAFEDNVKGKGFYEGVAVGSLEYLERRARSRR